jgi:hypothetical protein
MALKVKGFIVWAICAFANSYTNEVRLSEMSKKKLAHQRLIGAHLRQSQLILSRRIWPPGKRSAGTGMTNRYAATSFAAGEPM